MRPPLDHALDRLLTLAGGELRRLVTANAMTLQFPGATVRLGRDVAGVHAPSLRSITDPRLRQLLARIDPVPDSVAGSGTTDWSVLQQRMHFIADLFRCHHESERLFQPPYSPRQVTSMRQGKRPPPPL